MGITLNGDDEIAVTVDISPKAVRTGAVGRRQRILKHTTYTVKNSEGKELVVEIKVATKQFSAQPQAPGYGLTKRKLGDVAPHRTSDR